MAKAGQNEIPSFNYESIRAQALIAILQSITINPGSNQNPNIWNGLIQDIVELSTHLANCKLLVVNPEDITKTIIRSLKESSQNIPQTFQKQLHDALCISLKKPLETHFVTETESTIIIHPSVEDDFIFVPDSVEDMESNSSDQIKSDPSEQDDGETSKQEQSSQQQEQPPQEPQQQQLPKQNQSDESQQQQQQQLPQQTIRQPSQTSLQPPQEPQEPPQQQLPQQTIRQPSQTSLQPPQEHPEQPPQPQEKQEQEQQQQQHEQPQEPKRDNLDQLKIKFANKLKAVKEMGFTDEERILNALESFDGDIETTIASLISP